MVVNQWCILGKNQGQELLLNVHYLSLLIQYTRILWYYDRKILPPLGKKICVKHTCSYRLTSHVSTGVTFVTVLLLVSMTHGRYLRRSGQTPLHPPSGPQGGTDDGIRPLH